LTARSPGPAAAGPLPAMRPDGMLRVAIVSGRAVVRHGLAGMLRTRPERFVVATVAEPAGDGAERVVQLCDVVIYDLAAMADRRDRTDQTDEELAHLVGSGRPVLVFELFNRPEVTDQALAMGAAHAVAVDVDIDCLLDTVERVASGHVLQPGERQAAIRAELRARYRLTSREAMVLGLVAAGLSNQEIARVEYLSVNSIKTYVRTAYRKIGARSRSEAVLWAARHDLIALDPRASTPHVRAVEPSRAEPRRAEPQRPSRPRAADERVTTSRA
jgi:two-component system, NarL family, response regulator LiaR